MLCAILAGTLFAQTGTEFWVAPPDVTYRHNIPGDEPIFLNVTTGNAAAVVTISQPANPAFNGGTPIILNVAANSAVRHNMTSLKAQLETRPTNSVRNTGLLIESTSNITCYYESSNTNNPDILALKGANGLGQEFYIPLHKHAPFYNQNYAPHNADLAFASFDIVATENNTTVLIYSPVAVDGHAALVPFTVTLQRGQTYSCANTDPATHFDPLTHPSGAVVLSNKPIAVSLKDDSNNNPSGGCRDLMLDQIVPVNILGTDYVAVKGGLNATGDESMFIMAVQNNTQVYIDGNTTPVATLFAGQYYRHDMDYLAGSAVNSTFVSASKPVYAIHVTGFGCEMGMAILPPLNCAGSTQLSFTRSTDEAFFLNLLVRAGSENDFVVTGPGTATIPGSAFQAVPGTGGVWLAARIQYNLTQVPVNQAFIVTNTSDVFSLAIINGGAASGCRYGFFSEFSGKIVVDAGPNQLRCANEEVQLSGSVSGGSTTGIWTSNGSGTFQPSNTALDATYIPSVGDLALGSVTLTLTSTGNCTPESDAMLVTFSALPIAEAGNPIQACSNAPQVSLAGSIFNAIGGVWTGGAGTFLPSNSNLNATYTPTAAEVAAGSRFLYLTTTGNGICPAGTDSVLVNFTPSPTADAGPDVVRCSNNPAVQLSGSFTVATGAIWSGGNGTFDPSTTNVNAIYTPTAAEMANGSVTLTLTTTGNGNCLAVSDQMTITFTGAPTVNTGGDVPICANNASIPLNGLVTVASGGIWSGGTGSFSPGNTSLSASYIPTAAEIAAGTLTLTLTTTGNGTCNAVSSNKVISFTPAPIVDAGVNTPVCANAPAMSLTGTVTGATGGIWSGGTGAYFPNNATLNTTYTPSPAEIAAGSVTLTLTSAGNGNCSAATHQVVRTITPAPTANAGADIILCANNPVASLAGSFTVATGGVWSGGAGSFDPSTTNMSATYTPTSAEIANGSVTLTLTTTGNGNCLTASDQIVISFTTAPTVNAGPDVSRCANNPQVALNGSVTTATGAIWSGGSGSYLPNNTSLTGTYTPTASEIASGILTLTHTSTGHGNCSAVSDTRVITFTPPPVVNAGPNGTVCANAASINLAGSVIGATGGTWSGGGGSYSPNNTTLNAVYTPTPAERASGSITLTLTSTGNGTCNPVSDQVTWTITPAPTVNAGPDQVRCANNAATQLNGSFTVASGAVWSGGAGSFDPSTTNIHATYTPTAAEIATGNVTLTLTTTGNGLCAAVSDQITISFTPAPVVNAGPAISVCRNNANIVLNGSVTGATGGIWSGGAGSYVPNNTTLNATYTPTPAELASGTLTLTLTSTGNGNCIPVSASRTITFTPSPTVDAGPNGTVCANASAITLSGSYTGATGALWTGGTGTYNPNNSTLNAIYTPSLAERNAGSVTLTLTTAGNGNCNAVSGQVTYTITPAPTANAGLDRVLCANNASVNLSGSFTGATGGVWSGGNGTFDPSTTNMSAIYTPSAAEVSNGSVMLTLTTTGNGLCNAVSDQVLLTFSDAPSANAGADVTVCANNAAVALGGSISVATSGTWSGGTGTFSPNAGTLNATYTPGAADIAAGQVTLTLTTTGNGNCTAASDTRVIQYTPAPIVNAGPNGTVCANAPMIALNGSVTGAAGGVWSGGTGIFTPNNITLNANYLPSAAEIAAGTVTLTLTSAGNGNCSPVSSQTTRTITPAPTVNAGADQVRCGNNATTVFNASITTATGVQWSGGTGFYLPGSTAQNITYSPSANEIANGSVVLTATTTGNGNCAAVSDNVLLSFTPTPTANAGPDQSVSSNNANTTLAGSYSVATGIVWSGGAGSYSPNNTTVNAVYTPTSAEVVSGSVTLTMTTTGNASCVSVSDQMTIFFSAAPTANAGPDQTICANNASVVLNGSVTIATGGIWSGGSGSYSPNNGTLNATYSPSAAEIAAGSVTLTLTTVGNGNSNPVSDQVLITIIPAPVVNAGSTITVCANQPTAQLTGVINNATGGIWSGGAGSFNPGSNNLNATYTPTLGEIAAGTVSLTLTSTGNGLCNAVSNTVTINIVPSPIVNAGVDQNVCSNNATIQLAATVAHAGGGVWSGGTGVFSPSITALNATYSPSTTELNNGSVSLTLSSTGNGTCAPVSDQVFIVFSQSPTANAGADVTVCANEPTVQLNGSVTIAGGGIWSGGSGSFNPNNTALNATYLPSPAEVALGTVTLTLTTTQNGQCNPVSDAMVITINNAPVANAGQDLFVCSNNPSVQLGGSVTGAGGGQWSGGAGSFSPSIASLNAVYLPTAAEITAGSISLTLTTIGNGFCAPVSDQVLITFTASPTANAGADGVRCANNAGIQLNGSVTVANGGSWSGAQGTFTPNANSLNAVYTPSQGELAAGIVTLTLTTTGNNGCSSVSDEVSFSFTPGPTVNAGPDLASCANNPSVQLSGSVTVATGALWSGGTGSYVPNNTVLNPTYTPSAAEIASGSVTLTLTSFGNGTCNPVSDAVVITINPSPIVNAGVALTSCANNATVQLNGSVQFATGGIWSGGGTFSPGPNQLNAYYTPTAAEIAAGSATLTLSSTGNGLCNSVSGQVTITITPPPIAHAGVSQTLCANNAAVQLSGSVTNATGGSWSGGSGTFSPSANTLNAVYTPSTSEINSGSLWLYMNTTGNGGCLTTRDSIQVTFTPAPIANAGPDISICANASEIQLNGSVTGAAGGTWSGGAGTFLPSNTTLNATYQPTLLETGSGQITLTLTTTGIGNCNAVQDQVLINFVPVPVVNAGPDQMICANNPGVQINGFVGNAPGAIWSGGSGSFTPNNTSLTVQYMPTADEIDAGSVTLTLSSTGTITCAAISDQMTINFTGAPIVDAGLDQWICTNAPTVQLNGNVTNASGGSWSGGLGTFSPSANVLSPVYTPTASEINAGTVTLQLTSTGNGNCLSVQDAIVINFTPAPTANAGVDLQLCMNNPAVTLNGNVTVSDGGQWSGGMGTFIPNAQTLNAQYVPSALELLSGTVHLTLTTTGNGNCIAVSDQVILSVTPSPSVNAGADITTCSSALQVQLNGSIQGGASTGEWSTSGTGWFFPSATSLNATYLASSLDSLNGSVDLTLTSTNNGLCLAVSDVTTLTILPNAIANAGPDQSICASQASIQLNGSIIGNATEGTWTTIGSGTFVPNANASNAVYQLSASDTGLSSLTFTWSVNSCDNAMDQMVLSITPISIVNAGTDQVTCVSDLSVLINGSVSGASTSAVWSTLGSGTFQNPGSALSNIYHASPADSLANGVHLMLTATNTGVCQAAVDSIHVSILPFGTVNAGPDLTRCANNASVQLNGTLNGDAAQTTWTTSGTGSFFPNNTVLTPTYLPSTIDTLIGSITLTLSALNSCNQATDAMQLVLTPAPFVNAGPDQTYCDQITQFNLSGTVSGVTTLGQWTTTGTGVISDPFSLNTTYTASATDIANGHVNFVLRSLNNGNCTQVTDAMTIWITDAIQANAGPDQNVCVLSNHAQLQGTINNGSPTGIWSSTGTGTFSPSADILNAQYQFSQADITNGSVVLTLTSTNNGTCPASQDQMVITFGNASYAYAGEDRVVCANSPIVQLAGNFSGGALGSVWSSSGSGFFSNTTSPNATYTLSSADLAAGSVQLTLTTITSGSCASSSDQMVVSVQALATINAGNDVIACTAAPVQLNANAVNATTGMWSTSGTGTFLDANALTTLYYPSIADSLNGSVILTATTTGTAPCASVSDALQITFGGGLTAHAGNDIVACSTDPNITLNGVVSGTTTGQWSTTGTGSFTPSASNLNATYIPGAADPIIGNISLVLSTTNNQGCTAGRDTLVVTYNLPPLVNAGIDKILCDGLEEVPLIGQAQQVTSILWSASGNGVFTPSATALEATYTPTPNDSLVGGVEVVLTGYALGTCSNRTDTMSIAIRAPRLADAGTDQQRCANGGEFQLNGVVSGVAGAMWSTTGTGTFIPGPTALNATYVPSVTDMVFPQLQFLLSTTGNQGCQAAFDTLNVSLQQPPSVNAGTNLNTCDASTVVELTGTSANTTGVLWSTSGSGSFLTDPSNATATYQPSAGDEAAQQVLFFFNSTNDQICPAEQDSLFLSFVNPLTAGITVGNACAGVPTTFADASSTTGSPIIGWNWSFGDGTTAAGQQVNKTFPSSGLQHVTVTVYALNGCSATISQSINVSEAPVAAFGISEEMYTDTPLSITDLSSGALTWLYTFGDGNGSIERNPSHTYTHAGLYILTQTVTNAAGCSDRDSLLVRILDRDIQAPKLPNAFSPNGDGVNDVFFVRGGPFETMHLRVFNGWGELIFETTDPEFGWDGTHKGKPEMNGVYVYSVIATTMDGTIHDRSGKISLMR